MSVIVEYTLRSPDLVLTPTFAATAARMVIEDTVGTDPRRPVLFGWVEGDLDGFAAAVAEDPTVAEARLLSEAEDSHLYRIQVAGATELVTYPELTRLGAARLDCRFEDGVWYARTRFPDADSFEAYTEFLADHGADLDVRRRYEADGTGREFDGLTEPQREALVLAYRRGYFEVPRAVTTGDLAAELGVSTQAVSERLRRGCARLVEQSVGV
ncbi:helix-turn-helix domain-containing protein [Halosegnis marinus]|uniref:Helix-turn-helix domain-containing protein n=1 Tax=Halosegnis marinus TaxID=3034023 RepID=A0ABD5ZLP8_9EURY|nr:helix-turn-helix domain-containing protein [Halosegnis sp. DT85]